MMMNIVNAVIGNEQDEENKDFVSTPKTPVKIQMWTTDGNIVKADILGEFVKEMNGDLVAEYVKGDSPIDTRVDSDKNLHISIARPAQSYQVDYLVTSFADIYKNRDKNITFRPDANAIQSNVSSVITKDYAKFETLVDGKYTIYQVDSGNHWSSTVLDTTKVKECVPNETLFSDIAKAEYAYVNDDEIIYPLSEKRSDVIRFVNIGNDIRHIWSVTKNDIWTLTDESLCDNKMDKNPATINVGNGKLVVTNEGQIVLSTADNLVLNSTTLSGNVSNNVLKNLTQYFPEGNPLLLFAEKDASQYYYNKDLDIATLSTFFNRWTQADGSIKNALSKKMTMMNLSEVTFDILLSAYNNGGTVCIKEPNTGYVYFPCKYDAANKQFTYVTLLFYSETTGAEMRCLVQTYGEDNKLTFKYNIVLNDKYISGDNNVIVRQTGSRQYSILLNAETLEVEEQ